MLHPILCAGKILVLQKARTKDSNPKEIKEMFIIATNKKTMSAIIIGGCSTAQGWVGDKTRKIKSLNGTDFTDAGGSEVS